MLASSLQQVTMGMMNMRKPCMMIVPSARLLWLTEAWACCI